MKYEIAARSEGTGAQTETIGLPARPRPAAEPIPHIPDYRLVKVIGRGAFGTVWLAEETLAGIFRAIKILHPARTRTPKPTDRPAARPEVNAGNEEQRLATDAPSISKPVDPWASLPPHEQRDDSRLQREIDGVHAYQAAAKEHPHLVRILKVGLCKVVEPEQPSSVGPVSRPVNLEERSAVGDQQSAEETPAATASDAAADSSFIPHPSSFHTAAYYVMEIADHAGGAQPHLPADYRPLTLATLLRQKGRLPCEEVVRHATAMLDGTEHLHKSGLQHRDIKMANVLFVGGVLKLADMGLTASDDADETVGTPGYLPPPDAGSPPGRSFGRPDDLYALGKVMYEMLTGLPAARFPEWPADLDPASDPLLPRLRGLINELCHPVAYRRLADLRRIHQKLADIQSGQPVLRITRWRVMAAMTVLAVLTLGLGIGADRFWVWWVDPFGRPVGRPPYDGTGRGEAIRIDERQYSISRNHAPGEVYTSCFRASFWDIQTRLDAKTQALIVAGTYRIYTVINPATGDALDPTGEIDQVLLAVGDTFVLLFHGQPGPPPGHRSRFHSIIPLAELDESSAHQTIRLYVIAAMTPDKAIEYCRRHPSAEYNSIRLGQLNVEVSGMPSPP